MKIIKAKIASLKNDNHNKRKHDAHHIAILGGLLRKFGQVKPIVIDAKNVVVAGNGILAAAKAIGWTDIDCVVTQLKGSERDDFAIADNRAAELSEWEDAALLEYLQDDDESGRAAMLGFDDADLRQMIGKQIKKDAKQKNEGAGNADDFEVVTLTMSRGDHADFVQRTNELSKVFGTEGLTDTITECVKSAVIRHKASTKTTQPLNSRKKKSQARS